MMLEEGANNLLRLMASNGLVANALKTAFMFINLKTNSYNKSQSTPIRIKWEIHMSLWKAAQSF